MSKAWLVLVLVVVVLGGSLVAQGARDVWTNTADEVYQPQNFFGAGPGVGLGGLGGLGWPFGLLWPGGWGTGFPAGGLGWHHGLGSGIGHWLGGGIRPGIGGVGPGIGGAGPGIGGVGPGIGGGAGPGIGGVGPGIGGAGPGTGGVGAGQLQEDGEHP